MKILMVPDYSKNNPYQRELAVSLRKRGLQVDLCNFSSLPLLRAVWNLGRPEILHLHWTDGFIVSKGWLKTILKTLRFLIELLVVKTLGIKVIWTVHNISNHEKIKPRYERFIVRYLLRLYDQVIVHCSSARSTVIKMFGVSENRSARIHVVPHGNYINCYENSVDRIDARARLGYGEDVVVYLFLGSIRPYKGVIDLIEIFRSLENTKVKLLVVGNPADRAIKDEIISYCEVDDRIKAILQYVPENDIQLYMNAADVAVFPYSDILTSGSVILAMSFSKAVIAPRAGCIIEALGDQEIGLLYEPNDPDGLANALREGLRKDLTAIGCQNRADAEKFNWDGIAEMTHAVYLR